MTHNETRLSNERLAEMLADLPLGQRLDGSSFISRFPTDTIRAMILELQELRAHPLTNPSPSDGEVSDVFAAYDAAIAAYEAATPPDYRYSATALRKAVDAALQPSKRGQP